MRLSLPSGILLNMTRPRLCRCSTTHCNPSTSRFILVILLRFKFEWWTKCLLCAKIFLQTFLDLKLTTVQENCCDSAVFQCLPHQCFAMLLTLHLDCSYYERITHNSRLCIGHVFFYLMKCWQSCVTLHSQHSAWLYPLLQLDVIHCFIFLGCCRLYCLPSSASQWANSLIFTSEDSPSFISSTTSTSTSLPMPASLTFHMHCRSVHRKTRYQISLPFLSHPALFSLCT